jgi:hypothetical protein
MTQEIADNKWVFATYIVISVMMESAFTLTIPFTSCQIFQERGWHLYSIIIISYGLTAIVGAVLMLTVFSSIGYDGMFAISFMVTLFGLINIATLNDDEKYDFVTNYRKEQQNVEFEEAHTQT